MTSATSAPIVLALMLTGSTHAFTALRTPTCMPIHALQAWNDNDLGRTPSYSDDWLLDMHNAVQGTKQLITNAVTPYNEKLEEEATEASILEWQEAFQLNGLADFTPPMTAVGMNCLMVGADIDAPNPNQRNHFQTKLPWEEEAGADITNLMVVLDEDGSSSTKSHASGIIPIHTKLVPRAATAAAELSSCLTVRKEAAVYDCIVDQGLLGSVLDQPEQVKQLLREAAIALREYGIYVLTTHDLTKQHQTLLESLTNDCGLEWQFELAGVSDDCTQVSVARRFNTGAMPKVGRLSRYQP
jgi:hypothetical protein